MRKINKTEARKLYNEGIEIYFTPHKLRVNSMFGTTFVYSRDVTNPRNFDHLVNQIEAYNCNHEAGYYLAYHVED